MDTSPIVVDIETAAHPQAQDYLEPVVAARNLADPAKIAADLAKRTQERDEKIGLDWNVGRIVAIGTWTAGTGAEVGVCANEGQESDLLVRWWHLCQHRTIVGFHVIGFDLRYLIQRSRLLGVPYPELDLGKYARRGVHDLYLDLTFNDGHYDTGAMKRTLRAFARRFGIPTPDATQGKDIQGMVDAGDWTGIVAHCAADVEVTLALARKLRVIA